MPKDKFLTNSRPDEENIFELFSGEGFKSEIYPLLEQIMHCSPSNISYTILRGDDQVVLRSEGDLRTFLCQEGIPHAERLSAEELDTLTLWVKYTHVLPSDFTANHVGLTMAEIHDVLRTKLGLKGDIEELRVTLRGYGFNNLSRSKVRSLTQSEKVNLRVWAARSPEPLPTFQSNGKPEGGESEKNVPSSKRKAQGSPKKRPPKKARTSGEENSANSTSWFSSIFKFFSSEG